MGMRIWIYWLLIYELTLRFPGEDAFSSDVFREESFGSEIVSSPGRRQRIRKSLGLISTYWLMRYNLTILSWGIMGLVILIFAVVLGVLLANRQHWYSTDRLLEGWQEERIYWSLVSPWEGIHFRQGKRIMIIQTKLILNESPFLLLLQKLKIE